MSASSPPRPRPSVVGELAVVVFLLVGYDRVAGIAKVRWATGVRHAWDVVAVERSLHLDVELPLDLAVAAHRRLGQLLSLYYDFAHATVTFTVLLALYVAHTSSGYRQARRALVAVNGIALLVFFVLPVAPPRLLPGAGFIDVVAGSGTWGAWEAATSTVGQHANQYAAMPSLHVAWATWVLHAAWSADASLRLRGLAVTHLFVTIGVVLATGNHYVLDVAAGVTLAIMSWTVASAPWWQLGRPGLRRPDAAEPGRVPALSAVGAVLAMPASGALEVRSAVAAEAPRPG
jgi:hypothetical protein